MKPLRYIIVSVFVLITNIIFCQSVNYRLISEEIDSDNTRITNINLIARMNFDKDFLKKETEKHQETLKH